MRIKLAHNRRPHDAPGIKSYHIEDGPPRPALSCSQPASQEQLWLPNVLLPGILFQGVCFLELLIPEDLQMPRKTDLQISLVENSAHTLVPRSFPHTTWQQWQPNLLLQVPIQCRSMEQAVTAWCLVLGSLFRRNAVSSLGGKGQLWWFKSSSGPPSPFHWFLLPSSQLDQLTNLLTSILFLTMFLRRYRYGWSELGAMETVQPTR